MKKIIGIVILSLLWSGIAFTLDTNVAKKACEDIGYVPGTEKFADCALKLITTKSEDVEKKLAIDNSNNEIKNIIKLKFIPRPRLHFRNTKYDKPNLGFQRWSKTKSEFKKANLCFTIEGTKPRMYEDGKGLVFVSYTHTQSCKELEATSGVKYFNVQWIANNGNYDEFKVLDLSQYELEQLAKIQDIYKKARKKTYTKKNVDLKTVSSETESKNIPYFNFSGNAKQREKHEKKVRRYLKMPEDILCIAYLNNYGVFKKAKQDARTDALHRRSVDCNPYMQAAYYDKKRRDHEFAEATRKLIDGLADAEIQKQESIQKNYRALQNSQSKSRNCKYRKIGDSIRETCN